MRRLIKIFSLATVCLLMASSAWAVNSVEVIGQDQVAPNSEVEVRVKLTNEVALKTIIAPFVIRGDAVGQEIDTAGTRFTSVHLGWGERLAAGVLTEIQVKNKFAPAARTTGVCKTPPSPGGIGGFGAEPANTDTTSAKTVYSEMPVAVLFTRTKLFSPPLGVGADTEGSLIITLEVNGEEGCFIIDSTCVNPANHLLFVDAAGPGIAPDFTEGRVCVGIEECANQGLSAPVIDTNSYPFRDPTSNVVDFVWGAVDGADSYTLELDSVDESFSNPFYTNTLSETQDIVILDSWVLDPFKQFYWRVRANPAAPVPNLSSGVAEVPGCAGPWAEPPIYTSVKSIASAVVPESYGLAQNYPNPFNAGTVINFTNKRDGHVRLDVFNILGQPVITLVDEYKSLGVYTVDWDGRDASGQEVATGMYFYRLSTKDFSDVKKMTLLK